jgi:hypothetical protein
MKLENLNMVKNGLKDTKVLFGAWQFMFCFCIIIFLFAHQWLPIDKKMLSQRMKYKLCNYISKVKGSEGNIKYKTSKTETETYMYIKT